MSEERPTITSSRLTATEVARHNFGTVRRGLDPQEVRAYLELVARDMQSWEQREQELRQQIADLAEQVRHPVLDEATLTAALGQQSALVLRGAHEEAARVTADAEERAAALAREAQSLAAESSVRAEASAAERIAEAELAVGGVREQAQAEAQAIVDSARTDAEELAVRAREHGRHLVEEAQAARKRVLADLAQRRHALHVQIEQLRAARDLLIASVLGVREQAEGIADDLSHADERARAAAADAGRRAGVEVALAPDDVLAQEEAELPAELPVELAAELAGAGPGPGDGGMEGPAAGQPADQPGPERPPGEPATGEADAVPPAVSVIEEPAEVPASPGPAPGVAEGGPAGPTGGGPADRAGGPGSPADREGGTAGAASRAGSPERAASRAGSPESPGDLGDSPESAVGEEGSAEGGSIDSRSLEELFARIRASRQGPGGEPGSGGAPADPGTAAPDAAPGGTAATDAAPGGTAAPDAGPDGTEPGPDGEDQALLERGNEVLGPIVANLSRRLKRALADDQNGLLDRLRAGKGTWTDDVLASEEDHTAALAAVALEPLQEATVAGQALATELGGASRRARSVPVEGMAEELGLTVVRLLRRRLPGGEDGPAVADVDDASDAVGAAYRAWRGQRIESLVGDYVLGALGAGIVAVGGQHLRWVVAGGESACADCDDNSLAGAIDVGEEFPTGHVHPPAHAGCRCLVVPTPA